MRYEFKNFLALAMSFAVIAAVVAIPVVGQVAQNYDRRLDLSTQPTYAPFGTSPEDYRDAPSLYSSGNVRFGRAFTGNRNFLEDRYFGSPMTRFFRESVGAYDIYGGGRQYGPATPFYRPGSLTTRGDVISRSANITQQADPFGLTIAPPVTFAEPVELPRRSYSGAASRFDSEPTSELGRMFGQITSDGGLGILPSSQDNMRLIERQLAEQEAAAAMLERGPFGTPAPVLWRSAPADSAVEGRWPDVWLLLPQDLQEELMREGYERPPADPREQLLREGSEQQRDPQSMYWEGDEAAEEQLPAWLRQQMERPSVRERLIEAMRRGESPGEFGEDGQLQPPGAEEGPFDPRSGAPYGPVRPSDIGRRALEVGKINMRIGLYRQAIGQFERAAMFDSKVREEARRLEGHARLLDRSDRIAALLISESVVRTPEFYGEDFRLTQIVDNQQPWQQTLEYLEQALERTPDVPLYQFLYGYTLYGLGRHDQSRPYLEKVAEEGTGFEAAARVLLGQQ